MPRVCCGPNHPRGELLPDEKFEIKRRVRGGSSPHIERAKVCKDCQITQRLAKREADPYLHAFLSRRKDHAKRLTCTVANLIALGWDEGLRSLEMKIQHEVGYCPLCPYRDDGVPTLNFYRDMGKPKGVLSELTIDVFDPAVEPIWPGNVWWVCKTCNIRMQREGKAKYARKILEEHVLRKQEQQLAPALTLF